MSYDKENRGPAVPIADCAPPAPKLCTKPGCHAQRIETWPDGSRHHVPLDHARPVAVLLARVREDGRVSVGAFSDFGKGEHRQLRHGVEWLNWIARCAECYQDDADQARRLTHEPRQRLEAS